MSLFLAPIHYDMFNKIKYQDELNKKVIKKYNLDDSKFSFMPEGELEEIVDQSNIHGSLQSYIDVVESSFSKIVMMVLESGNSEEELLKWFEEMGKNSENIKTADEIFRHFTNSFLDGMPCDRAIQPVLLDSEKTIWIQNVDVHGKYWEDEGVLYNKIRESWLKGLSESNGFKFGYSNGEYEVEKCTE